MPVEFVEPPEIKRNSAGFTDAARRRGSGNHQRRITPELLVELTRAGGKWARVETGVTGNVASTYTTFAKTHPAIGMEITTRQNADNNELRDVYARIY